MQSDWIFYRCDGAPRYQSVYFNATVIDTVALAHLVNEVHAALNEEGDDGTFHSQNLLSRKQTPQLKAASANHNEPFSLAQH